MNFKSLFSMGGSRRKTRRGGKRSRKTRRGGGGGLGASAVSMPGARRQ
jgi:hypothetical protein